MENKSKIAFLVCLLLVVFSCIDRKKQSISNQHKDLIEDRIGRLFIENGQLTFESQCFYSDVAAKTDFYAVTENRIKFKKLIDRNNDTISLDKIIDQKTFHLLGLKDIEEQKIRNPHFYRGRLNCYYSDKNFTYAFVDKSYPEFKIIGASNKATFIGGNYLKVEGKIYSNGIDVKNVDFNSFKTFEVHQDNSEWKLTIASDKNHLFLDEKIMTKNDFNRLIAPNDSLEKRYFK